MFELKDLKVNYGGIEAVRGISFSVPEGSIVTLIGANGARKSTTLRTIAGLVKAHSGSISFDGDDNHEQGSLIHCEQGNHTSARRKEDIS